MKTISKTMDISNASINPYEILVQPKGVGVRKSRAVSKI